MLLPSPSPGYSALVVAAAVHLAAVIVRGRHVYVKLQHWGATIILWVTCNTIHTGMLFSLVVKIFQPQRNLLINKKGTDYRIISEKSKCNT